MQLIASEPLFHFETVNAFYQSHELRDASTKRIVTFIGQQMKRIAFAVIAASLASQSIAQTSPVQAVASADHAAPLLVAQAQTTGAVLPANTELNLVMNDTITTKGNRWKEGDTFGLSVVHDVRLGGYVVIPRGSRGVGRITWLTSKGAFGKSGKMEIDLEYVEGSGRRIPIQGHYRQEGEGNTVATIGGVIVAGVFAGFITGKSGTIPQGRELVARTKEDLPVAFAGPPPASTNTPMLVSQPAPAMTLSQPVVARPVQQTVRQPVAPAGLDQNARVKCATCR